MRIIKTPGGGPDVIHTGTEAEAVKTEELLAARHEFIIKFCGEKGWPTDPTQLSIAQIMEVRKQPGWQKPLGEDNTSIGVKLPGHELSEDEAEVLAAAINTGAVTLYEGEQPAEPTSYTYKDDEKGAEVDDG